MPMNSLHGLNKLLIFNQSGNVSGQLGNVSVTTLCCHLQYICYLYDNTTAEKHHVIPIFKFKVAGMITWGLWVRETFSAPLSQEIL